MICLRSFGTHTRRIGLAMMMCTYAGTAMGQLATGGDAPAAPGRGVVTLPVDRDGPTPRGVLASDLCSAAPTVGEGTFPYDLSNATNDFPGTCGATANAQDVWYRYVPTCTGSATVETCALTAGDSVLLALDMCGGTVLACNDDACSLQSRITFAVVAGEDYFIRMADFGGGVHVGSIRISCAGAPPNDDCGHCLPINGLATFPFDNTFATTDGAPDPLCLAFSTPQIERDLWYCWTSPCPTGSRVILQTCGLTTVDTKIAIYDGPLCPPGPILACNDDSCGTQSRVEWTAVMGQTYLIRLGVFPGAAGGAGMFAIDCLAPAFSVTGFSPPEGREGDVITIVGTGFGNNPDNICAVVMQPNGADATPMRVLTATDTQITAVLRAVDPTFEPGMIMVGLGSGDRGTFQPVFRDVIPEDPNGTWVWDRAGGPAAFGPTLFRPIPRDPPPRTRWFFGQVQNGVLCVVIDGNWMRNTYIQVQARAHSHHMDPPMGADLEAFCIRIRLGGSTEHCAHRICDVIRCAFLRRGIIVNCRVDPVPGTNSWKITVIKKGPNGEPVPIDWGNLNVCVYMPFKFPLPSGFFVSPFFNADVMPLATGGVRVLNIGSSGEDGASVDAVDAPRGIAVETEPIDIRRPGGSLQVHAWGTHTGNPDAFLGGGGLRFRDSFFDVFADFSDIGATMVRAQMYTGGMFMGEAIVPSGNIGMLRPPGTQALPLIIGCGKLPPNPPCIWIDFDRPVVLFPQGIPTGFAGTQLRLLAQDPVGTIDTIALLDLAAGNVMPPGEPGSFVIRNAFQNGPACPCDWNGDGVLNSQDFFDFLVAFFDNNADFNRDGTTNSQDFFDFLTCFFTFPPGCR